MKTSELFNSGVLLFLLGTMAPIYAQPAQHDQGGNVPLILKKKPQGGPHKQQIRGQRGERPQPPPPPVNRPQVRQPRQMQAHQFPPPGSRWSRNQHQAVWQEHRAQNWQSEHRDWRERGGYDGYRIPSSRYRGHFGPRHMFRVSRYPVGFLGGYINFQYGGFGFSVVDPLPEYWSDTWYNDDDVYIDFSGGGYYMHNRRYPQDRIAISVNIR